MLGGFEREWLVTDQHGGFAMGTPAGLRTRKYHSFFSQIVGRGETAYFLDLDVRLNGEPIWPHRYAHGMIEPRVRGLRFTLEEDGPCWMHFVEDGVLHFTVHSREPSGIELRWKWDEAKKPVELLVRPFFSMRPLQGIGGEPWTLEQGESAVELPGWRARIRSETSERWLPALIFGALRWRDDPRWRHEFYYPEEESRGYPPEETLFSSGVLSCSLNSGEFAGLILATDESDLSLDPAEWKKPVARTSALDFVLKNPPGVAAGFPWFGEQGRDTFVALPGIVAAWLEAGGEPETVADWAEGVLARWSEWIVRTGMIPNQIGPDCQWESADCTLWWCHSLAALWAFSLASPEFRFRSLEEKFIDRLNFAVKSVETGKHLFLTRLESGLLEVSEPHVTWMDAAIEGAAVASRIGILPEINALWFQAKCLQALWSGHGADRKLGTEVLKIREPGRPNEIFLHSLPFAPSFVLQERARLESDVRRIAKTLWTPMGLRTLDPSDPRYRGHCLGDQWKRDSAYHQGGAWAWLGGHFEMARNRMNGNFMTEETLSAEAQLEQPITGHIAEIFDGDAPHAARGAPAQAWSLACLEEARARTRHRVDAKLTEVFARRWLGRAGRRKSA